MQPLKDSQTWYVIFDRSRAGRQWWHIGLRAPFRHVSLWREVGGGVITVNPLSHVMAVKHYEMDIGEAVQRMTAEGATAVLAYTVEYSAHYRNALLEPLTCVTVAKRILGIRRRRVVTPWQLYRELLSAGAQVVRAWSPYVTPANEA